MQRVRYIESMDSVRFNSEDETLQPIENIKPDEDEALQPIENIKPDTEITAHHINEKNSVTLKMRESQLLVEILISMLFGYRIAVQQSFSFDSLGLFKTFNGIIKARDNVWKNSIPPAFRNPFIFSFFDPKKMDPSKKSEYYMKIVAEKLIDPDFRLSGWKEIDSDLSARKELASLLIEMNIDRAVERFPSLEDKIETLHRISNYINRTPILRAERRNYDLKGLTDWIKNLPDSISIEGIEPDFIIKLKNNIIKLEDANIPFLNRSKVRQNGKNILPLNDLVPLLEYVDTIYNIVVSDSMGTHSEILSTSSQIHNGSSNFGEKLARMASKRPYGLEGDEFIKHDEEYLSMAIELSFENLSFFNQLLENTIEDVWQIIADEKWQESINKLHLAMLNNSEETLDLRYSHICLLSDKLKSIMIKPNHDDKKSFGFITAASGLIGLGVSLYFSGDLLQVPIIADMAKQLGPEVVGPVLTTAVSTASGAIGNTTGKKVHKTKKNVIYKLKSIGSAWDIKRALDDAIVIG